MFTDVDMCGQSLPTKLDEEGEGKEFLSHETDPPTCFETKNKNNLYY
jgi:hypothetical protein